MQPLGAAVQRLIATLLWPLDQLPATAGLTLFSLLSGMGLLLVVGRTTPQHLLRLARARMSSAIYEIRLYLDSPKRIFLAQWRLLRWSGLYLACLLPGLLAILPVLALLYAPMEARYGLAPLSPGTMTLLRLELEEPDAAVEDATIAPHPGVELAGPAVLVAPERTLYLGLKIIRAGTHDITIRTPGWVVAKQISADAAARTVAVERRRGMSHLFGPAIEGPLPADGPVKAVSVAHPARPQRWLGIDMPWWLFWMLAATASALALRRPFRVSL